MLSDKYISKQMTIGDIKAMLGSYIFIKKSIDRLENERTRLYQKPMSGIVYLGSANKDNKDLGDKVIAIKEIEYQINDEIKELSLERARIIRFINCLPDEERLVIQYKYMDDMKFWEIANEMTFSVGWVRLTHKKALEDLLSYHFS